MRKNDAIKSLYRGVILLIGVIVPFVFSYYTGSASTIVEQTTQDYKFSSSTGVQTLGVLGTQSVTTITLVLGQASTDATPTWNCTYKTRTGQIRIWDMTDCDTSDGDCTDAGEMIAIPGTTFATQDIDFDAFDDKRTVQFVADTAIEFGWASLYGFDLITYESADPADCENNTLQFWGSNATASWPIGYYAPNPYGVDSGTDTYFVLTNDYVASTPSVSWTSPADLTSYVPLIDFTGTATISHAAMGDEYFSGTITGSWGTSLASAGDNTFFTSDFNTETIDFDAGFAPSSTGSIYVQLTITDNFNSKTYTDTRTIYVASTYTPGYAFSSLKEQWETKCDEYGLVIGELCNFFVWLIIPTDTSINDIGDSIDEFNDYPPFSYWKAFTDELTGYTATTAPFDPIPDFVDDYAGTIYWICFAGLMLKFSTRLFKG